ncbi:hypothetical protein PT974_12145 [Cladobotryum mycophilum]|uniref:AAA+ ATPase domain-containing protein n=1 Tax=Cladobotryum mycophilum TaxID=491253 RepID=A0ABR0S7R0_9HYPO
MSTVEVTIPPACQPEMPTDNKGTGETITVIDIISSDISQRQPEVESTDGLPDEMGVRATSNDKAAEGLLTEYNEKRTYEYETDNSQKNTSFKQPEDSNAIPESKGEEDDDNDSVTSEVPKLPEYFEELIPTIRVTNLLYGGVSLREAFDKERARRESGLKVGNIEHQQMPIEPDLNMTVLHQIRINSPTIMKHLYSAANVDLLYSWTGYTFSRPFKILIHFQPQMKEALHRLEMKWGNELDIKGLVLNGKEHELGDYNDYASDYALDSKYALSHLRVYVKFIDENVMPLYQMLRQPDAKSHRVLFTDLWYLFREGDLVYSAVPKQEKQSAHYEPTASNTTLPYQSCWKVYSIITPRISSGPRDANENLMNKSDAETATKGDDDSYSDEDTFRIWCYYIDYDGKSYRPVRSQFQIRKFNGEREIRSLPLYPIGFLPNKDEFLSAQKASGETFRKYIEGKHLYHSGWTLTRSPTGAALDDVDKHPEHIEGEAIADFAEAYQTITSWKPEFYSPTFGQIGTWEKEYFITDELISNRYSPHQTKSDTISFYYIPSDDIGIRRRNQAITSDVFLSATNEGDGGLSGDFYALLPKRLIVFSFPQRKFIHANINCLKAIDPASGIFEKLSINPDHKLLVRSLVREHFRKKKWRHDGQDIQYQDLIRGKGTGLVFPLHGVPGVGKTTTAEAVAQENSKPLFAITCGDLGFEPIAVEKNLSRIFRLANLWDCILLLDEADIFFTKRTPNDLQRNALVAVFLRILEYYNGILFLTTNRVGIIDEAFKSRIHMSLYYPPLNSRQYRQIFELNIKRIEEIETFNEKHGEHRVVADANSILIWSESHYAETHEVGRWNGRQIKNAFQIAASLVRYDLVDGDSSHERLGIKNSRLGHLDAAQFSLVAQATNEFDDYMAKTKKGTDIELAKKDGVRNDTRASPGMQDVYHRNPSPGFYGDPSRGPSGRSGPSRYPPPQDGYREQYGSYYPQESRRWASDEYGQPPPSHGHRQESGISLSYGYPSSSDSRKVGDVPTGYERDVLPDGPGGAGQLRPDDGGYMHGRGQVQRPQDGYPSPASDANYERHGGMECRRESSYDNPRMGGMPQR